MESKIILRSKIALVLVCSLLFLASCGPAAPVKPWDSKFLSKIRLSFQDVDVDPKQIAGDVLLKLNDASKPSGINQYVLYWGGGASSSSKGDKIAEVSVNISGDLLYSIPQDTAIPSSRKSHFLLFLKNASGAESYSGINTRVTDKTQALAQKKETEAAKKAETEKIVEAVKIAETEKIVEAVKIAEVVKIEKAELAKKQEAAEEARIAKLSKIVIENVLFEYDRSYLKPEFKQKLVNSFADVQNKDEIRIVISGHADERGSNEYNLALGERRAYTVKRFLISLGLLEQNISVISYGEEKPVDSRHNDSAWEKNRRAETDYNE